MWYHHYRVSTNTELAPRIHRVALKSTDEPIPKAKAGRFTMVYIPDAGELPLSVYRQVEDELEFIIEDYGGPSSRAVNLKVGEQLGVRGPYGRGFTIKPNTNYLLVAGGSGAPPLLKFVEEARFSNGVSVTYLLGARTADELFLLDEPRSMGARVMVSTDDGTMGYRGLVTQLAEELLAEERYDALYACGPEPMLQAAMRLAEKFGVYFEGSFVRDVRCAIGLCGLCVMEGTGRLLCVDGPVFSLGELSVTELVR
ncbi:MAG: hypothetical protein QW688_04110 [Thermoprotei archaeon]